MIIKREKKGGVIIYTVDKSISDSQMNALQNTLVKPSQISLIINENADVYTTDHVLLLRFRKKTLSPSKIDDFYTNIIQFAMLPTTNRGSTSGSKKKNVQDNPKIMTNVFGFIDKFSPKQKFIFKQRGYPNLLNVRACRFNVDYPEKYKKTLPLLKEIDSHYKSLMPAQYELQRKKSNQIPFKIPGTSFTTVTTNVNFQTTIHKDKGDDIDGFGNLTVIGRGKYAGAETCFPQYGIGVNAQTGDILFMNVHEWHGNLPFKKIDKDAIRLSIVCYLRTNLWEKTKGKTHAFMLNHIQLLKSLRAPHYHSSKKKTQKHRPKTNRAHEKRKNKPCTRKKKK